MVLLKNMWRGSDAETQWLGNVERNCLLVFREVLGPVTHETHSTFPCSIYIETWTLWPHNAKDIRINKTTASLCTIFQIPCILWRFHHCQLPLNCSVTCVYCPRELVCVHLRDGSASLPAEQGHSCSVQYSRLTAAHCSRYLQSQGMKSVLWKYFVDIFESFCR